MQKNTISLCMIVKNEEKYLDRCLKSVQGKVDEIIIADTGSTDRTIEIAQKYGAIISRFEWINDFAAARNYSISEAKSEYILVLDADEYLDDSASLENDLVQKRDYYKLLIKNYQSEGRIVFNQNIRLFKSGIGLRYSGKLHEHLSAYDGGTNYIGAESNIVINHVGYLPEVIADKGKKKRNYDIMVKELEDNPTGYSYYNMGLVYVSEENYDKALDMFKKSYPLSEGQAYLKSLIVRTGECLCLLDRTEEAITLLLDAIKVFPQYADLHYPLGVLFLNSGYLKDAEIEFKKCLEIGEKVDIVTVEGMGSYMANYQLAIVYDKMGKIGDAFDEAYKAVLLKKSFTPALSKYLKLMQCAGIQPDQVKEHLSKIYIIDTVEELKALIYSLYELRYPLMNKFGFAFQDEHLYDVRAVAFILDKQFDKSLEEWEKIDVIPQLNILDAAVLCLLSKDRLLLDKLKASSNFSNKEWKSISEILLNETIGEFSLTMEVEKLLLKIGEYLLHIDEFEQFEYISAVLLQCSIETQVKLASMLLSNGYTDTAMDLLTMNIEKYPNCMENYIILGDAYSIRNKAADALECYSAALGFKDEYYIYEKIYDACEKMGESGKMEDLKSTMKKKFPLSIWLKNA
ncbi:MAG TPA: glycosyltransferase [Clostridia bacterium]|nr:glycosyltransferase [Clostridia bacterium]